MTLKQARPIVEKYHYAHVWPGSAQFAFGVRRGREVVGVVVLGCGANRHAKGFLRVGDGEFLELLRLWLKDSLPRNSESQVIAATIRLIRKHLPQVKILLSYADPYAGHLGTIYQATNWMYVGRANPVGKVQINGQYYHFRTIHDKYGTKDMRVLRKMFPDARTVALKGKFTYVYPMTPELREHFKAKRKPYPTEKDLPMERLFNK